MAYYKQQLLQFSLCQIHIIMYATVNLHVLQHSSFIDDNDVIPDS